MKKRSVLLIVVTALLFIPFSSASCAEVAPDFSMVGTWKAEHDSNKISITLNDNHKGVLAIEGLEPIKILKWEEEFEKKGKVNIGLYFFSRDKKRFAKRSLKMYNSGKGFKLKAIYQTNDKLDVYNTLYVQDGKIKHDDGKMELKR